MIEDYFNEPDEGVKLADVLAENRERDERARWAAGNDLPRTPRDFVSFAKYGDEADQLAFLTFFLFIAIAIVAVGVLLYGIATLIGAIATVIALIIEAIF
jgi:hypothetical protein